jgi:hypothetical protein
MHARFGSELSNFNLRVWSARSTAFGTTLTIPLMQQRWSGIWGSTVVPVTALLAVVPRNQRNTR